MAVFNSESKSISARTVQRETKWLGPNSYVALKLFISETNRGERLQLARNQKDWTLEWMKKVLWFDDCRFTLFQWGVFTVLNV